MEEHMIVQFRTNRQSLVSRLTILKMFWPTKPKVFFRQTSDIFDF